MPETYELHLLCPPGASNLPIYLVDFKAHCVKHYLVNAVLVGRKDLSTYVVVVDLKSNLYVGLANIYFLFWHREHVALALSSNLISMALG